MKKSVLTILSYIFIICISASCIVSRNNTAGYKDGIATLHFIDEYVIPYNFRFNNTTVGGLSGIDHDRVNDLYYFICDDRSAIQSARFYSARINISATKIDTLEFLDVRNLLQRNGETYPAFKQDPFNTTDPEAIRYHAPRANWYGAVREKGSFVPKTPFSLILPSSSLPARGNGWTVFSFRRIYGCIVIKKVLNKMTYLKAWHSMTTIKNCM